MIRIFKDDKKQREFEDYGYVTLNLIGPEEIKALTDYYLNATGGNVTNSVYGMYVSLHDNPDLAFRKQTMAEIRRIVEPKLKEHFHDFKTHLGSYLVKVPNAKSYTYPHQDWTFVDNERMSELCSLTVWITLKDLDPESGTLGFIKGSSNFFGNVLASPSPAIKTVTQGYEPMLLEYLSFPKVRAGDALAFNNKTIHAALPNVSNFQRIALGIGITPKEAVLYHYFLKPGTTDTLLKLRTDEEFFIVYSNQMLYDLYRAGKVPEYCTVEGELKHESTPITQSELESLCVLYGSTRNGRTFSLAR